MEKEPPSPAPPEQRLRRPFAAGVRVMFGMLCALGLCTLTWLFIAPACGCQEYTPRARISESILAASSVKTEISERYQSTQTLRGAGRGLSVPLGPRVASATVSEDGVITLASKDPPALITITPTEDKNEGRLRWTCLGKPETVMPPFCRP